MVAGAAHRRLEMDFHCQHCGERIVTRGFGKCPGCYRDLPEELLLTPKERELEEMEEKRRIKEGREAQSDGGGDSAGCGSF